MEPLPKDGRLLFFAELRPDLVYVNADREVVALAIHEFPTVRWHLPPSATGGRPPMPDEIDALIRDLGVEGKQGHGYSVLELEAQGRVVDDWFREDVEDASDDLAEFPGAVWEELPADSDEAVAWIQQRLAEPPRG